MSTSGDLIIGEGRVENVLEKRSKTGKAYYAVRIDGIAGTTWDLGLGSKIKPGLFGKYAFKQDGDFKNLVSFEASGDMASPRTSDTPRQPDETGMRIARSHALTTGVNLAVATAKPKDTPEALLNVALDLAEKVKVYTVTGKNPLAGPEDPLFKEV